MHLSCVYPEIVTVWKTLVCSLMQSDNNASNSSLADANGRSSTLKHTASLALERQGGTLKPYQSMRLKKRLSMYSRSSSHSKINFGDANDDVHLCILCLRAIMNHQVWLEYFSKYYKHNIGVLYLLFSMCLLCLPSLVVRKSCTVLTQGAWQQKGRW